MPVNSLLLLELISQSSICSGINELILHFKGESLS
jgi:hypothetical protein